MKSSTIAILLFFLAQTLTAQIAPDKYFVRFTDKNNSPYSIDNPGEFLSQRAIDRRINQGISLDESDLPVNLSYLDGVEATGATVLNPSKWLNGVSIFADDPAILELISALPYVDSITIYPDPLPVGKDQEEPFIKPFFRNEIYNMPSMAANKSDHKTGNFDYGMGLNQIHMLNGDLFHEMGYRGQGKVIAVLDAGFYNADILDVFDSLWDNGRILGTRDFVRGGEVLFDDHTHGSMVLSCMGGNYPGQLIGTAPEASYWLLRSEDGGSEYLIEEYNWVSAAEYADSVGADVINSSLGYTEFNDPNQNHTYSDMNGDNTPVTFGADMAAKKGILVVNSLGNEGSSSWYYLSAPSDGDSVMGIGAVDGNGNYVSFSSHGPSFDGRVKPDAAAQGSGVYVVEPFSGGFTYSGGTSFSSPILAGMAACLWQANPSLNNMQIADAIRQSGNQYLNPDIFLGYGIPDIVAANNILTVINGPSSGITGLKIYPNPFSSSFVIDLQDYNEVSGSDEEAVIEIFDMTGRLAGTWQFSLSKNSTYKVDLLKDQPDGIYSLRLIVKGNALVQKIIKSNRQSDIK